LGSIEPEDPEFQAQQVRVPKTKPPYQSFTGTTTSRGLNVSNSERTRCWISSIPTTTGPRAKAHQRLDKKALAYLEKISESKSTQDAFYEITEQFVNQRACTKNQL
jgi:hypothetical protein